MSWKQPIPTSITNLDIVSEVVLCYILLRLQNKDMETPAVFWHGNKRTLLLLKKGQCLFNVKRFCLETKITVSRVNSTLKLLKNLKLDENVHIKMNITRKSFGLVITMLNFDETFSFESQSRNHTVTHKDE